MAAKPDYIRQKYAPLQAKTLQNAVANQIANEFPRIGGPRMQQLCAEMILDVVNKHLRKREHLAHGCILWAAVRLDDPPKQRQRIAHSQLVPVVLEVSTDEDIQMRLDRESPRTRLKTKAIRLCQQTHEQGGLLSNCDLAEILGAHDSRIASVLTEHERETGTLVPRRATLHDLGTGLTHKRIICRKRYLEGKEPHLVALETYHSLEAVDRYLSQYDRVRHCRKEGMTPEATAHILKCSLGLVREYLKIDDELEKTDD